ncbi:MAG TPA: hypothetical protein VM238_07460 [Phycisphaerae bacterium]|nr:hypothetical protein [Phycisphaerae bacterium]
MQAVLRSISAQGLLAVAALGGDGSRRQIEHELDLRATNALVSRILTGVRKGDGSAACRSAEAPVAA